MTLLKTLGALYGCCVGVTRESTETEVRKAYRAVSKGVHPDRGGNTEDQKRLDLTYGAWNNAGTAKTKAETKKGKEGKKESDGTAAAAPTAGEETASAFSFFFLSPSFSFFLFLLLHCLGLGSGL